MGADLKLVVGGRPMRFPAVWLRDNCPCPDCLAPGTGQKLKDITDIPNGLAITRTEDAGQSVLVTFAPDQHRSAFPRTWLEDHALGDGRGIGGGAAGGVRAAQRRARRARPGARGRGELRLRQGDQLRPRPIFAPPTRNRSAR